MTLLGDAYVRIRPDLSSLNREMDRAGKDSGSRFSSAFSSSAKVAGGLLAGALGAAAGLGIKTAAEMEKANIAFETMLGSADKAKTFIGDLQKFAAKTPFEFPELQTAASSLISVGVQTDKVIPIMTTLGNVTSGMGTGAEGVKRATVALQQMSAAGRITGEDLNQLRDAGVPVFDLLAAATGKSKEEVAALAQSGKLGKSEMEALFKALETGKGLERFNGLMEKQSASLSGVFSTLKDNVQLALADLVTPALPAIKSGMEGAAEAVQGAMPRIKEFFSEAVRVVKNDVIPIFRDDIIPAVKDVLPPFMAFGGFLKDTILPALGDLAKFLGQNADIILPMAATIGVLVGALKVWSIVQGILNAVLLANPITLIIVAIGALVGAFVYAWKNSETFREVVVAALNGVKDFALGWVQFIIDKFLFFAEKIVQAADMAFGWVPGLGDKLGAARTAVEKFRRDFNGEIDKLQSKDITLGVNAKGQWSLQDVNAITNEKAQARALRRRAGGGLVLGAGSATSDSIMAKLSNGEYVMRAAAVKKFGVSTFNALNAGVLPGYAKGGRVGGINFRDNARLDASQVQDKRERGRWGLRRDQAINYGKGKVRNLRDLLGRLPGFADGGYVNLRGFDGASVGTMARSQVAQAEEAALNALAERVAAQMKTVGLGGSSGSLVALGRMLQGMGARVSEHPAFGGVNGVHANGSKHYVGRAIDVNYGPGGANAAEMAFFDRIESSIRAQGFKTIWRAPGHYNHLHAEYDNGGLLQPGLTTVYNRSGKPEAVLTNSEMQMFKALVAQGGSNGALVGGDLVIASTGDTRNDLDEAMFALRRRKRGGR